jgi:dTDP-4-dehydrorhamnose reductase
MAVVVQEPPERITLPTMKILLTGANGQLGRAVQARFAKHEVVAVGHDTLDVGNHEAVMAWIDQPLDLIIHAAAMTNVDGCERDPEAAYRANAIGTQNMALLAQATGAEMVHISTDYVYDGKKGSMYWEGDATNPLSMYASSKLAGEYYVESLLSRYYICRTAWVFGPHGNNFARKIVELSEKLPELKVVTTESGHPTYAPHLADGIARLVAKRAYGRYHMVNEGCVSRYDFARAILETVGRGHVPIQPTDSFPRAATPPAHVHLSTFMAREAGAGLPHWREGLTAWAIAEGYLA